MCGASDNCATQMSLTLTLSRQREREKESEPNPLTPFPVKEGGTKNFFLVISSNRCVAPHPFLF
jgi:hypothetical protein